MSLEQRLVQAADALPGIRLMVLFGSMARGRPTGESDVDVGVLLEESLPAARRTVEAALGRAAGL